MALKFTVDDLESVPESVRDQYVEDNGKFRLALDGYEDPAGLKSALEKERKAAREASKQAKAWESLGKTPEEISELLEAQKQAEQEKARKEGNIEKIKEAMLKDHEKELAKYKSTTETLRAQLEHQMVHSAAVQAIAAAKGIPALLLPHVKAAVKVLEEDGQLVTRVVDESGNPRVNGKGEFLSIADLVSEMRNSDVFGRAFDGSGATGGGASGSKPNGSGGKIMTRAQFDALGWTERRQFMAAGGKVHD